MNKNIQYYSLFQADFFEWSLNIESCLIWDKIKNTRKGTKNKFKIDILSFSRYDHDPITFSIFSQWQHSY